ncbi:FG-GAP repeat domain-containing protein [Streptomyces sp. V4I23]|uniref:FG-GAP repeat domain-containing protein n=1 Tax=Streptomyces sp. V4I23 TaxID=3042282 RepID=UPI00358E563B
MSVVYSDVIPVSVCGCFPASPYAYFVFVSLAGYASVSKSDLTFAAHSSDPDDAPGYLDLKYLHFAVWQSGSSTRIYDGNRPVDSLGNASITLDGGDGTSTNFYNGKTYFWAVRAIDSTGAASAYAPPGLLNCGFIYDASAPNSPKVTSTKFPEDDGTGEIWSDAKFGTAGAFTFSADGSTDTVKYSYSFNSLEYGNSVSVSAGASATVTLKPPTAALNVLYVKAVDSAGNSSPTPTKYLFYVSPRDTGDGPGDLTGDAYPDLLAVDGAGNLRSYASDKGNVNIHAPGAHDNNRPVADSYWAEAGKAALISHATDWYPGDGITDVLARMPDGKLYLYPGDGYGSVDVSARLEVLLPEGAPAPSALTQIAATEDITGDGKPDAVALVGQQLWAFTGYTGASFRTAQLIGLSGWANYDVISARDISGDGIADLLMRGPDTDRGLLLRKGKPAPGGGVDFASFASATSGAGGAEVVYGTSGWGRGAFPMLQGTPDADGDTIPDFWAVTTGGALYFYPGKATTHGTRFTAGESGWAALKTLG